MNSCRGRPLLVGHGEVIVVNGYAELLAVVTLLLPEHANRALGAGDPPRSPIRRRPPARRAKAVRRQCPKLESSLCAQNGQQVKYVWATLLVVMVSVGRRL